MAPDGAIDVLVTTLDVIESLRERLPHAPPREVVTASRSAFQVQSSVVAERLVAPAAVLSGEPAADDSEIISASARKPAV